MHALTFLERIENDSTFFSQVRTLIEAGAYTGQQGNSDFNFADATKEESLIQKFETKFKKIEEQYKKTSLDSEEASILIARKKIAVENIRAFAQSLALCIFVDGILTKKNYIHSVAKEIAPKLVQNLDMCATKNNINALHEIVKEKIKNLTEEGKQGNIFNKPENKSKLTELQQSLQVSFTRLTFSVETELERSMMRRLKFYYFNLRTTEHNGVGFSHFAQSKLNQTYMGMSVEQKSLREERIITKPTKTITLVSKIKKPVREGLKTKALSAAESTSQIASAVSDEAAASSTAHKNDPSDATKLKAPKFASTAGQNKLKRKDTNFDEAEVTNPHKKKKTSHPSKKNDTSDSDSVDSSNTSDSSDSEFLDYNNYYDNYNEVMGLKQVPIIVDSNLQNPTEAGAGQKFKS